MKSVRELHTRAMELAQQAGAAYQQGNDARGKELFKRASRVEADAAGRIGLTEENEPTRSILYNSAASLAVKGEDFELALQLADCGLQGNPSPRIAESLNELKLASEAKVKAKDYTFIVKTIKLSHDKSDTLKAVGTWLSYQSKDIPHALDPKTSTLVAVVRNMFCEGMPDDYVSEFLEIALKAFDPHRGHRLRFTEENAQLRPNVYYDRDDKNEEDYDILCALQEHFQKATNKNKFSPLNPWIIALGHDEISGSRKKEICDEIFLNAMYNIFKLVGATIETSPSRGEGEFFSARPFFDWRPPQKK